MSIITRLATSALISAAVCFMLGLVRVPSMADPSPAQPPFANSVEQRMEMIAELRKIRELLTRQNDLISQQNTLLKEQNDLLRKLTVTPKVSAEGEDVSKKSSQ
ncbi:hypothetical protein [Thermogutta sp.]|uniref:hypothetical protein n=1 Tax=Thermogutta sp. TaxID=1962930 RepID=UPI0032201EF0